MKLFLKIMMLLIGGTVFAQVHLVKTLVTPMELSGYTKLSSHEEILNFLDAAASESGKMKIEYIGYSTEGRAIPAVKISSGGFGSDENKIRVLFFAQQHGDEPSGKEGSLFLIRDIAVGKLDYIFDRIDLIIIPQMNPDGAEKDKRRNESGLDLNRNHLILTAPETQALHKLFNQYMPEVTLDVHEYYPYSKDWIQYGAIKNFDEQIGAVSNPNVSSQIKNYTREKFLPFIDEYLNDAGFTFHEYILEGPPDKGRIRHSTFDINDGRQSFGSLNTFSLIFEGKNGRNPIDNIQHRAEGQFTGMIGLLEFIYQNKVEIKAFVEHERQQLIESRPGEKVAVQMEHTGDGSELNLKLLSVFSNKDTIVTVQKYHPIVKPVLEVEKPLAYLIPKSDEELAEWIQRHNIKTCEFRNEDNLKIIQYFITAVDSIDFEGDMVINPSVKSEITAGEINFSDFYFIPTNQLYGNIIVQALEPKSELGLATYKDFEYLVRESRPYPILRVVK